MNQDFIENDLIILTKQTIDKFLSCENSSDLISLYTFYYYTAKWQGTNQPKCNDKYTRQGLHWGSDKLIKAQKKLVELGLIEKVSIREKTGKISGWYIKVKYIFKNQPVHSKPVHSKTTSGFQETNALSTNKLNALSTNNKYSDRDIELTNLLLLKVKENYPFSKDSSSPKDYLELNRLHRIDGFPYEVIEGVISWASQDDFWKQNIRSVVKLRKHFNSLLIKAKSHVDTRRITDYDSN